jgi:hypothetical protein
VAAFCCAAWRLLAIVAAVDLTRHAGLVPASTVPHIVSNGYAERWIPDRVRHDEGFVRVSFGRLQQAFAKAGPAKQLIICRRNLPVQLRDKVRLTNDNLDCYNMNTI